MLYIFKIQSYIMQAQARMRVYACFSLIDQRATGERNVREVHARLLSPKYYTVRFCLTKIAVDALERIVMAWCIPSAEFRQITHVISNVKPAVNIGV
jgi:hypothetical protein